MQQYRENRLRALAAVKAAGMNPYPHKFKVDISVVDYVKKYGGLDDGEHIKDAQINLAGIVYLQDVIS